MRKKIEIHAFILESNYIYFIIKVSFMLKSNLIIKSPTELSELERFFHQEIDIPDQRITLINFPFYNFVCYAIDILTDYVKSSLDITLNVFIVDSHVLKH